MATGSSSVNARPSRPRELARSVLALAIGAGASPFVPLPFLDDWVHARLLERVVGRVLADHAVPPASPQAGQVPRLLVRAYLEVDSPGLPRSLLMGTVRFVVRKAAMVLDVHKSQAVFGRALAMALAVDFAARSGWIAETTAPLLGQAIHRTLSLTGAPVIESLARAAREAQRGERFSDVIGTELDEAARRIETTLDSVYGTMARSS